MPNHRSQMLAAEMTQLAFAVPQVVAFRLVRMALAGPTPSPRDQAEFRLMSEEKWEAFAESWRDTALAAANASSAASFVLAESLWPLSGQRRPSPADIATQWQRTTLSILGKGLAPMRRRAVANAKRLSAERERVLRSRPAHASKAA
jgi:hypothetical protein